MKTVFRLAVMALAALVMGGCFQVERVVTVRPDGSGTLEETVMFSQKVLTAFTAAFQNEETAKEAPPMDLYDEQGLISAAANMGTGVTYLRSAPKRTPDFTGYTAVYAFTDINQLRMDSGLPSPDKKPGVIKEGAIPFVFTPAAAGKPASLVLKNEKAKKGGEPAEADAKPVEANVKPAGQPQGEPNPKELEMLKEMLGGMRFAFSVVVDGKIVETNATHHDSSRITLADVDFTKLLSLGQQDLAKINAVKEQDLDAVMAALKDFPGVKVDMNEEVRVLFR